MSDKETGNEKLYSGQRWNEPIGGKVIGEEPLTKEEEEKAHKDTVSVLKSMGIKIKGEKI